MKSMKEVLGGKPCGFSPRMTDDQVRHCQHAINHADALADALDFLIQECGKVYSNSSALGDAELKAKIALANYRGEP